MFRKLVSNLSFSPALITQVSFYANRLRKEEVTRRMTVGFVVMALVVQSLAIFSPPESANASSEQDLIRGGVQNLEDFLIRYDKNTEGIKDLYTALGVTRDEIASTKQTTVNSKDSLYSMSRYSQYSVEQGEASFTYSSSTGGTSVRFVSPLKFSDTSDAKKRTGTSYEALVGQSSKLGWFGILEANASPITKGFPATVTQGSPEQSLVRSISVMNVTQGVTANTVTAKPFDKLSYTITVHNSGSKAVQTPLLLNVSDSLEYATLIDSGGARLQTDTNTLAWPSISLPAGASQERTFMMQIGASIPATPTGKSNANSFDCKLSSTFGTSVQVPVDCPAIKGSENIISDLPKTGIFVNVTFSIVLVAFVSFFYLRTRQLKKEIRLIRHNLNTGTI